MAGNEFAPITPGQILKEEFLTEYGLSQNKLAKAIGISPNHIAKIVNNRRRITADTALRLSLYFGNSPEFWMNLQATDWMAIVALAHRAWSAAWARFSSCEAYLSG